MATLVQLLWCVLTAVSIDEFFSLTDHSLQTTSCLAQVDAAGSDDIWSIDACVAAATLNGVSAISCLVLCTERVNSSSAQPENIITLNKCQRKGDNSTFPNRPDTSSLNYNVG